MAGKDDELDDFLGGEDEAETDDDAGGGEPEPQPKPKDEDREDGRVTVPDEEPTDPKERDSSRARKRAARDRARMDRIVQDRVQQGIAEAQARWEESRRADLQTVLEITRRPPDQPQKDPIDDQIEAKRAQIRQLLRDYNALSVADQQSKQDEYQGKIQALQSEERSLELDKREKARPREQPQRQADPFVTHMRGRYPEVYADETALRYADVLWRDEIKAGRVQNGVNNFAVFEACLAKAKSKYFPTNNRSSGDRRSNNVSQSDRQKLEGTPRGSSGGGGGSNEPPTISPEEARMATAMYPGIPKKQAIAKWFKKVKSKGD